MQPARRPLLRSTLVKQSSSSESEEEEALWTEVPGSAKKAFRGAAQSHPLASAAKTRYESSSAGSGRCDESGGSDSDSSLASSSSGTEEDVAGSSSGSEDSSEVGRAKFGQPRGASASRRGKGCSKGKKGAGKRRG